MTVTAFGPQGPNYSVSRPPVDPVVSGGLDTWMKACSAPGATDGTYPTADFFNQIIANLRIAVGTILGNAGLTGGDNMLFNAIEFAATPQVLSAQASRPVTTSPAAMTNGIPLAWGLNTLLVNNLVGASLNVGNGQVTLAPGTYVVRFAGMVQNGGRHYARIRNVTDSVDLALGLTTDSYNNGANNLTTPSVGEGVFTLLAQKVIALEHVNQNAGPAYMGDSSTAGGGVNQDAYLVISRLGF